MTTEPPTPQRPQTDSDVWEDLTNAFGYATGQRYYQDYLMRRNRGTGVRESAIATMTAALGQARQRLAVFLEEAHN